MHDLKKLQAFYDQQAPLRETFEEQDWKKEERSRFLYELELKNAKTLLELGAGAGKDSRAFMDEGLSVTATDLSPEMVKLCKEKGVNARVMNYMNLSFAPKSFDAVFARNSLLHTPKKDLPSVLRGIRYIMKPEGLFYMGVHGGQNFEKIYEDDKLEPKRFFASYTDEDLLKVVRQVFELIYFRQVDVGDSDKRLHYQSLVLKKR